jgi:3',5'-cyclic AMP phosphodiesterase CpdA
VEAVRLYSSIDMSLRSIIKRAWLLSLAACLAVFASSASNEPFFFIQLSDPQFGMFTDNKNFAQETANFEFAVANINRLRPAFVVITGDLVNKVGDPAQIKEFKRILAKVDPGIPVYNVAGNHDVGNAPTPEIVSAYTNLFGPDHYAFHYKDFVGIVLDSSLIQDPTNVVALVDEQERWLETELQSAQKEGAKHIAVFQHHSWFLNSPDETNQYFNLPLAAREKYLPLFHQYGVNYIFCGHYHRNLISHDGNIEVITTCATGKPVGGDKSGMQVVIVRDGGLEHHYYAFGEIPNQIVLQPK